MDDFSDLSMEELESEKKHLLSMRKILLSKIDKIETEMVGVKEEIRRRKLEKSS